MKRNKHFLSICLTLLVLLALAIPAKAAEIVDSGDCGENAMWSLDDEGILTISGTGPMENYTYYGQQAPWLGYASTVKRIVIEEGITEIGTCAFSGDEYSGEEYVYSILTEVEIPETVTIIRANAFAVCPALETIHIPASVKTIEHSVFANCENMQGYTVDEKNTAYTASGGVLFSKDYSTLVAYPIGSPAKKYTMPKTIVKVDPYAFSLAVNLEEVEFNEGLVILDDECFFGCTGLTKVDLPDSLKVLMGGVFQECRSLAEINLPNELEKVNAQVFTGTAYYNDLNNWTDGVLYLNNVLLTGLFLRDEDFTVIEKDGALDVRYGTRLIAAEAFFLGNVTSASFPETLLYICDGAFYASDLEEANLPNSLLVLEDSAFHSCDNLRSVRLGSNLVRIGSGVFNETPYTENGENYTDGILYCGNYLLDYNEMLPDDVVIREGTTMMADQAFFHESGYIAKNYGSELKSVTFPESLTTISYRAFLDCNNLKRVELPATVIQINEQAFGYDWSYDYDLDRSVITLIDDFAIDCTPGTAAEAYAIANGIDYFLPAIEATSIEILGAQTLSGYSYSGKLTTLQVRFAPDGCTQESVVWSSSDDTVAEVRNGAVYLCKAGTAVITATTPSGLSDSVTVVVEDKPYITLDSVHTVEFAEAEQIRSFLYTPNYTDTYLLEITALFDVSVQLYENGGLIGTFTGSFTHPLSAGKEYELTLQTVNGDIGSCDLQLRRNPEFDGGTGGGEMEIVYPVALEIVSAPNKLAYITGESLDLTGLQVRVRNNDNSYYAVEGNINVYGFDSTQLGSQMVTVVWDELSTVFEVLILPATVTFLDDDGTLIQKIEYAYGETITVPAEPVKPADDNYIYTFAGWNPEVSMICTGNAEYKAQYTKQEKRNGWILDDGKWYYYENNAYATGWRQVSGIWYYFDGSGIMQTDWQKISGKWYYFAPSGSMSIGWLQLGNVWYYMDNSGAMVTGTVTIGAKEHSFNASGVWLGEVKQNGWISEGGKWYYYVNGVKETGWKLIGSTYYYFNTSGVMQTGWLKSGNIWYYLKSSGAMATGWATVSGKWYYFNASGAMVTGWQKVDTTWYYFQSSGAMQIGWLKLDNTWYYFHGSGAMATGSVRIGNKTYNFNASGACLNP